MISLLRKTLPCRRHAPLGATSAWFGLPFAYSFEAAVPFNVDRMGR